MIVVNLFLSRITRNLALINRLTYTYYNVNEINIRKLYSERSAEIFMKNSRSSIPAENLSSERVALIFFRKETFANPQNYFDT